MLVWVGTGTVWVRCRDVQAEELRYGDADGGEG